MNAFVKNGLTLIGLLVVGGLGYYLFVLQNDSELNSTSDGISKAQLASDEFLRQLDQIKTSELSDELFRDERFVSFIEFTEPVQAQPIGRDNPFAPVE